MDQVRRRKRLFDNKVVNTELENGSKISFIENGEITTRGICSEQIKLHNELTFMEALKLVLSGNSVTSCIGKVYSQAQLQPNMVTERFIISNAVTTERERKGKWRVV